MKFHFRQTVRLELLFLFSQYGLREATLYNISFSFLRETTHCVSYFYGNVNKKKKSLRSLLKDRAFINSSATTRKSKQKLENGIPESGSCALQPGVGRMWDFLNACFFIVSAWKHLSNTNLSDLSIVGTRDIFVYR